VVVLEQLLGVDCDAEAERQRLQGIAEREAAEPQQPPNGGADIAQYYEQLEAGIIHVTQAYAGDEDRGAGAGAGGGGGAAAAAAAGFNPEDWVQRPAWQQQRAQAAQAAQVEQLKQQLLLGALGLSAEQLQQAAAAVKK
jgi:hypothetical protein